MRRLPFASVALVCLGTITVACSSDGGSSSKNDAGARDTGSGGKGGSVGSGGGGAVAAGGATGLGGAATGTGGAAPDSGLADGAGLTGSGGSVGAGGGAGSGGSVGAGGGPGSGGVGAADGAALDTSDRMVDGASAPDSWWADVAMEGASDMAKDSAPVATMDASSIIDLLEGGPSIVADAPQAADASQSLDLRDAGLDHRIAADQAGPTGQTSGCFSRSDFRTCDAYCASIARTCVAAGCGGLTYELWESPGSCLADINRRGWSSDGCTAQILSVSSETTIRCCCQQ